MVKFRLYRFDREYGLRRERERGGGGIEGKGVLFEIIEDSKNSNGINKWLLTLRIFMFFLLLSSTIIYLKDALKSMIRIK